jgi:hypothetical protein
MQSTFFCFGGRFSYFRKSIFLFQKIFVKDTLIIPSTKDTSTPSNESCPFKLTNTCLALCQRLSRIDTVEVGAIRTATMCSIRTKRVDTNPSLRLYQETRRAVRSTSVSCAIASCMPTLKFIRIAKQMTILIASKTFKPCSRTPHCGVELGIASPGRPVGVLGVAVGHVSPVVLELDLSIVGRQTSQCRTHGTS